MLLSVDWSFPVVAWFPDEPLAERTFGVDHRGKWTQFLADSDLPMSSGVGAIVCVLLG